MKSSQTSRANAVHARVVLAALIVLFACGFFDPSVDVEVLSPRQYDPVPPESVKVLRRELPGSSTYERIAILDASGGGTGSAMPDTTAIIRALQKKAGSLGANAIVIQQLVPQKPAIYPECGFLAGAFGTCDPDAPPIRKAEEATGRALAIRIPRL
jgi:hypothetical protein